MWGGPSTSPERDRGGVDRGATLGKHAKNALEGVPLAHLRRPDPFVTAAPGVGWHLWGRCEQSGLSAAKCSPFAGI